MKTKLINQTFYPRKTDEYIHILVDGKWVLEHRFLVEEFIGRKLDRKEAVHHINFNKLDNRINNLFLFKSKKEHKSFENKVIQFGLTNPIKSMILNRWNEHKPLEVLT